MLNLSACQQKDPAQGTNTQTKEDITEADESENEEGMRLEYSNGAYNLSNYVIVDNDECKFTITDVEEIFHLEA